MAMTDSNNNAGFSARHRAWLRHQANRDVFKAVETLTSLGLGREETRERVLLAAEQAFAEIEGKK
jgi:hypothetical protein